ALLKEKAVTREPATGPMPAGFAGFMEEEFEQAEQAIPCRVRPRNAPRDEAGELFFQRWCGAAT
ncbi:MAG: hypothetical protein LBR29_04495, partial [Methylobacteriaceae bacterium]|nr:hypothetical protein [Methylobacteriaceae bacterium]